MLPIELKIPALVQQIRVGDKPQFRLRPLFQENLVVTQTRYQEAVAQFRKEIRHLLRYFELNRENASELLWLLFSPRLDISRPTVEFRLGRETVRGQFLFVRFQVQQLHILYLPDIRDGMLIEENSGDGQERAQKLIRRFLKQQRDSLGDTFDVADYCTQHRDFLTHIEVKVHLKFYPNRFEQSDSMQFLASLFDNSEFDGAIEIGRVGQDWNEQYPAFLNRAYYREELVERVYHMVYGRRGSSLAIVGPEGVGRHTLLQEVAYRYLEKHAGREEELISIWQIDPSRIIAGMSIVGSWQKRLEAIIEYLRHPSGMDSKVAHRMLVDNPIALLRIGRSASSNMTLSDVLKPYLEKRQLQMILVASPQEWALFQEKNRSFSEVFQVIRVPEPDVQTAMRMVLQKRKALEKAYELKITVAAIKQLQFIHRNYLSQRALPGGVLRPIEQLAVKYRGYYIDADEVRREFQQQSGLRARIFDDDEVTEAYQVDREIMQQLLGQERAVEALADVVHLYKAKLQNRQRPISSMLFIGPTGVGKTQAAKVLSRYILGSADRMLRFDMNEYVDANAVQRLLGDSLQPEGQLTGKVRYQPFSVLLLDEIEKAHPNILDLLLQVLDDGRLTDSLGRTVDFTNTIIIMTSNIGADNIGRSVSYRVNPDEDNAIYRQALKTNFRPEFVNRIDRTVIFRALQPEDILGIARLQINELLARDGFVRRTTILNISQPALQWVAHRGYDRQMGGRALRRQIEKDLTALSADQLLRTDPDTPIILNIDLRDDQLYPRIQPLTFVQRLNTEQLLPLPEYERGARFYGQLLQQIEYLERDVEEWADRQTRDQVDWQYFDLKTKLDEQKEKIRTMRIAFSDRYYREALAQPLRLKRCGLSTKKIDQKGGLSIGERNARYFQEAALQELSDAYRFSASIFDHMNSEFIAHYLDVAFLRLRTEGFLQGDSGEVELRLQSMVHGIGQSELDYLYHSYEALLRSLDIPFERLPRDRGLQLQGYGLLELMRGEAGIHLFYPPGRNPIPLQVSLHAPRVGQALQSQPVIRMYDAERTLTDLRTGFTNAYHMTVPEHKLLLFAGLSPKFHAEFMPSD